MDKIKVSEIFYSIQGEGRFMGVPSVFLRTFGCNFTCDGFGMPKGECSKERDYVASKIEFITDYKNLPLVSTGCDSYASWDPRFKHLSPVLPVSEIAATIVSLLPNKRWEDEHLVITGGEPLLGWQKAFPSLLRCEEMKGLNHITFETNGTQSISEDLFEYFRSWIWDNPSRRSLTFSVSPKLSRSGHTMEEALHPDIVATYLELGVVYLKFVVADEQDLPEIETFVEAYRKEGFTGPIYLMPEGGVEEEFKKNNRRVAEMAISKGWRYSDRLHVSLWKNAWGT